ncbi:ABC-2 type transport system ATP-binding protein [Rheinheimera pacifica]|uniref:ABC transporter ATP-binding protein n=1 Tax=Rheinheimera pacifica TaxID=173990 RepID=UPI0028548BB2|nr:ABC transporter ATP-binding protein [Rheinheimera pacifica]MDR6984981.1 ABC-2 type transport system ATP-binding protein [Rheinheimera pacifica]
MSALPLQVTGLTKHYAANTVLAGVDIALASGEVLCILGPNGAGKTTLISAVLGLVNADSGQIRLFGQLQTGMARSTALRQKLGIMMQIGSLSANLTVFEQCDLFSSYYQNGHNATELVNLAGLDTHANQRFGRLSGGQKQRLLFALALAGKPQLVFLDEPTLGMDVEARRSLWQQVRQLKQQGVAVVLTTHYLEEAEQLADRILVLNNGQIIAQGSPAQLKAMTAYKFIQCCSTLDDTQLTALPAVQQLTRQPHSVVLQSNQVEHTLRALLAQDCYVTDLEVRPVALEQAFLQLTQSTTAKEQ